MPDDYTERLREYVACFGDEESPPQLVRDVRAILAEVDELEAYKVREKQVAEIALEAIRKISGSLSSVSAWERRTTLRDRLIATGVLTDWIRDD